MKIQKYVEMRVNYFIKTHNLNALETNLLRLISDPKVQKISYNEVNKKTGKSIFTIASTKSNLFRKLNCKSEMGLIKNILADYDKKSINKGV